MIRPSVLTLDHSSFHVADVPVFIGSHDDFVHQIISSGPRTRPELVVTPNVDQLINLHDSPEFRKAYSSASVAVLDGKPLVLLAKALGVRGVCRITGSELIFTLAQHLPDKNVIVITGGDTAASQLAAENLQSSSEARIIAIDFPFIDEVSDKKSQAIVAQLNLERPTLVFLCLGSPKQELWFDYWHEQLPPALYIGAGAAVDFAAGRVRRAPAVFQWLGLEWVWRLVNEPIRLWRRYLLKGPRFLPIALKAFGTQRIRPVSLKKKL